MTSKTPDDLYSAFADGEVSPEEAAAKARLGASGAARQELQDYQRLSGLLRELPRRMLCSDFAAEVMQRAERETLIPIEAGTRRQAAPAAIIESPMRTVRASRRNWILTIAGVAVVVGAFVLFEALPTGAKRQQPAQVASRTENANDKEAPAGLDEARLNKRAPLQKHAALSKQKVVAGVPLVAASPSTPALHSVEREGVAQGKPNGGGGNFVFPADLKTAKRGDVIEALE